MSMYLLYFGLISLFLLVSLGVRIFVSLGMREFLEEQKDAIQSAGD